MKIINEVYDKGKIDIRVVKINFYMNDLIV